MNTRTDILIAYVAELRQKAGKFERMQKLRLQLPAKESEYQLAVKEEQEAGESVERAKKEFDQIKLSLTREMVRFERERQKDICAALCNYGQTQVQAGRDRTLAIRRLLEKFTTS